MGKVVRSLPVMGESVTRRAAGAPTFTLPIAQVVGELTTTTVKDTNAILHVTCGASRPACAAPAVGLGS